MENENMVKVYRLKMVAREIDDIFFRIMDIDKAKSVRHLLELSELYDILPPECLNRLKADIIAELTKRQEEGYAKLKAMGVELDKVVLLEEDV